MLGIRYILVFMSCTTFIECLMEPFGINGELADFPHSALMYVTCNEGLNPRPRNWMCGASIVNEKIALTAAQCIVGCTHYKNMTVSVGHWNKYLGDASIVRGYYIHEKYNSETSSNDIALMTVTKKFKYGTKVKRIALMAHPPYYEKAQVAGFGMIDEENKRLMQRIRFINQYVWKRQCCREVFSSMPKGTYCASNKDSNSTVSW